MKVMKSLAMCKPARENEINILYRLIRVKENISDHDEVIERLLNVLGVPSVELAPRVQVLKKIEEYKKR